MSSDDHTPTALPAYGPSPENPTCAGCGTRISPEIARVVGDREGRVRRCRHCADGYDRTTAAATGADADGTFRVAANGRRGGGADG